MRVGFSRLRAFHHKWLDDSGGLLIYMLGLLLPIYAVRALYPSSDHHYVVIDVILPLISLVPTWLAYRTSVCPQLDRGIRYVWRLFFLALLCNAFGELLWSIYEVGFGIAPFPSLADAAYLSFYPLMLWGFAKITYRSRSRTQIFSSLLDISIVVLAGSLVIWYIVVRPIISSGEDSLLVKALALAYPVGDILTILGVAIALLVPTHSNYRHTLGLLAGGLLANVITNTVWSYYATLNTFEAGSLLDAGWILSYFLAACSAQYQRRQVLLPNYRQPNSSEDRLYWLLPSISIIAAYGVVLHITGFTWGTPMSGLVVGTGVLICLITVRQATALLEIRQGHQALCASEERFRTLVQNSSDIITVIDADLTITYQSPAVYAVTGFGAQEYYGAKISDYIHPDDLSRVMSLLQGALAGRSVGEPFDWRFACKNKSWIDAETICSNLTSNPSINGIVMNTRDISERKALYSQLAHQAFHDPLTGLANRTLFQNRIKHALELSHRNHNRIALFYLDLDDFKRVNDTLGHATGDEVLKEVAKRLQGCMRNCDTIARLGGDEFALLIEDMVDDAGVSDIAEGINRAISSTKVKLSRGAPLSASIGIATASGSGDVTELLRNADIAMYAAKAAGKGNHRVFHASMYKDLLTHVELEADLYQAAKQWQYVIEYQPVFDLRSLRPVGMEALLRWEHPKYGLLHPDDFIALAEETELIVSIGQQVLWRVCKQVRQWQDECGLNPEFWVSVNISAKHVQSPSLFKHVISALENSNLKPESLVIELTESAVMNEFKGAVHNLDLIRKNGIHLAVDDFGTGYTSLGYLRRFPIDIVKIDGSFIKDLSQQTKEAEFAHVVLSLPGQLHLTAVAEGIETKEQLDYLMAMGYSYGQGYYLCKPMNVQQAQEYLTSRAWILSKVPS